MVSPVSDLSLFCFSIKKKTVKHEQLCIFPAMTVFCYVCLCVSVKQRVKALSRSVLCNGRVTLAPKLPICLSSVPSCSLLHKHTIVLCLFLNVCLDYGGVCLLMFCPTSALSFIPGNILGDKTIDDRRTFSGNVCVFMCVEMREYSGCLSFIL